MHSGPDLARGEARAFVGYCIVAFAWTWMIWWGSVIATTSSIAIPLGLAVFLGGGGPLLGALFVLRGFGRTHQEDFLRRLWDPRRVTWVWRLAFCWGHVDNI